MSLQETLKQLYSNESAIFILTVFYGLCMFLWLHNYIQQQQIDNLKKWI